MALPVVYSVMFIAMGVYLSKRTVPDLVSFAARRARENPIASHQPRDEVHLCIMTAVLAACRCEGAERARVAIASVRQRSELPMAGLPFCVDSPAPFSSRSCIGALIGSHLLGAFVAGIMFTSVRVTSLAMLACTLRAPPALQLWMHTLSAPHQCHIAGPPLDASLAAAVQAHRRMAGPVVLRRHGGLQHAAVRPALA